MTEKREDKTYNLEEWLIDFAMRIIWMAESLPETKVVNHNNCDVRVESTERSLILKKSERSDSTLRHSIFDIQFSAVRFSLILYPRAV